MRSLWPVVVVVVALIGVGAAGLFTAPGAPEDARVAQRRLDALPMTVGPWEATPTTLSEKQRAIAQAQAHVSRTYRRAAPPAAVALLVLYGDSGPLGAHTPEVCYEGAGFTQVSKSERKEVPGAAAEFWAAKFETGTVPASTVEVAWGWGAGGVWKASDDARLDFAGHGRVYKLYVSRVVPPAAPAGGPDVLGEFLAVFVKELRAGLFDPPRPDLSR